MDFKNKVVIVTGAASGIGAAIAVAFSNQGAKVGIVDRDEVNLKATAARCTNPLVINADLSIDEDIRRIVDQTVNKFGQLDVLINNAGLSVTAGLLDSNIMESYDTVLGVNLRAVVHLTSLAAPHLIKTKGNVVIISSIAAHITTPKAVNYSISKAAVKQFGACAAAELAPHGIRVNSISPGPVRTNFMKNSNTNLPWEFLEPTTCLNRVSDPEEIADLVMFLASDKAKGITGSDYLSDNGMLLKRN